MNFALNQAGFPTDDFTETCELLASAGYEGIEPNYTSDGPITYPEGRRKMKRATETHNLSIPAVSTVRHWEYPLSSLDETTRQKSLEIGRKMIDAAVVLEADDVLIVPAVIDPGAPYKRCYDRALESVRELARYGAEHGIRIAVENVQNDFLYSPSELRKFVEAAAEAGPVSVYFDVGNGLRGGLPDRWIKELGELISKIHIKDWLIDDHRVTYPLQGDVDWPSVIDALETIDYEGWITAEVPPYETFPCQMPAQVLENMKFLFERTGTTGGPTQ